MAKNILLLFLSNVRPNDDIKYTNLKGKGTKGSSESAIRWLLQENIKLDKIFVRPPILRSTTSTKTIPPIKI